MSLQDVLNPEREQHPKVWGYEDWLVNDKHYNFCGKNLVLLPQHHCSLHYHNVKIELFYVNKGIVFMEFDGKKGIMTPGQTLLIRQGQRHRFTGITHSEIIEFSTHHRDEDSIRESPSGGWTPEEYAALTSPHHNEITHALETYKQNLQQAHQKSNAEIDLLLQTLQGTKNTL